MRVVLLGATREKDSCRGRPQGATAGSGEAKDATGNGGNRQQPHHQQGVRTSGQQGQRLEDARHERGDHGEWEWGELTSANLVTKCVEVLGLAGYGGPFERLSPLSLSRLCAG